MERWLPPCGFTAKVHELDARVGGKYHMHFTNFTTQSQHAFGGTYVELKPNERIVYTDKFDDPALPGEMRTTVTIRGFEGGTELNVEQTGIPDAIPVEMCYMGWQDSLMMLAYLVEPNIPDGP